MTPPRRSVASLNRRQLLQGLGASTALAAAAPLRAAQTSPSAAFLTLLRQPDTARILFGDTEDAAPKSLQRTGDRWTIPGAELRCILSADDLALTLHAPGTPVRRLHLRWQGSIAEDTRVLGDAWERSYGDLAWLPLQPERPLPWYCLLATATGAHGYGVRTGASALCFWQADPAGLSLWLDLRNGGCGVELGDRRLPLAHLVQHQGAPSESPFAATQALCTRMAPTKPLPTERGGLSTRTLFGSNDWYYAYGRNSPAGILRDADLMRELAPASGPRPFTVIDYGYQDPRQFPDMAALAAQIAGRQVIPGLWIRPLRAPANTPAAHLLPAARFGPHAGPEQGRAFDPTVPEARAAALAVVRQACDWGYRLIKHDFTTWELLGQWGSAMVASPTRDGWHFHDRSRTNAEILTALYQDIRATAGDDRLILGCNTVGHLAAGLFDAQRTGDDVSGRAWERTRRMGVNTLAFRLPQHGRFFSVDADCVPLTSQIPWTLTQQWLRAVAATGTVLLVSPEPGSVGPEQKQALREAFATCATQNIVAPAQPTDWLLSRTPEHWQSRTATPATYRWLNPSEGASPFSA